jgi:hypothetical protein
VRASLGDTVTFIYKKEMAKLGETFSTDMNENTGLRSALQPENVNVNCFTASSFVLQQQHEARR